MNVIKKLTQYLTDAFNKICIKLGVNLQWKLIVIFLIVKVIPLVLITAVAWNQINVLGTALKEIAVSDSSKALNDMAIENIERLSTDTARNIADFLYGRDSDILYLASLEPSDEFYRVFVSEKRSRIIEQSSWILSHDQSKWVAQKENQKEPAYIKSTNHENNDMDGFNYRPPDALRHQEIPLYDEVVFIDLNGNEIYKAVAKDSPKKNYPLEPKKRNVSKKENTYIQAENYFEEVKKLKPGQIYVSDVIGAYVGTNYIGMYTPGNAEQTSKERGYPIQYDPEKQAFAGMENPNGVWFEGIVRWATPLSKNGKIVGYVAMALNHNHIMRFVDHITPMQERYTELSSAYEGNYAFIWDYLCRSISHPRHHSIVGFDPETGARQVPWLEASIYERWQKSGVQEWTDIVKEIPAFDE